MTCECGCGYEGEDEVAQFLIEEAILLRLEVEEHAEQAEEPDSETHTVARSIARRDALASRMRAG